MAKERKNEMTLNDIEGRDINLVKIHKEHNNWFVMFETSLVTEMKRRFSGIKTDGKLRRYNSKWYIYLPFAHSNVVKSSRWSQQLEDRVSRLDPKLALWVIAINSKINTGWVTEILPRPKAVGIGRITGYMKVFPEMSHLNNQQKIRYINMFPEAAGLPATYVPRTVVGS